MTSAAMTLTLSPFSPAECVAAVATRMADFFESKEALVVGLVERERERGTLLVAEMEGSGNRRGALLSIIARYFVSITREAAILRVEIWSESTRNPAIAALTARTEAETRDWFVTTFAALATHAACDPEALYALLTDSNGTSKAA